MEFFTYKRILEIALYSYLDDVEEKISKSTNHRTTNKKIVPNGLLEIEALLLSNVDISNKDFGILVSSYPVLLDYIPRNILNELIGSRTSR